MTEYGYCHCGCGGKTGIATRTVPHRGFVKGEPHRFMVGHYAKWVSREQRAARFVPGKPGECWEWTGPRNGSGYGVQKALVHRLAYERFVGPIPEGMMVCHHCDNPPCWNPEHLFVGTQEDNMADMAAKGRQARGVTNAKLTPAEVLEIRRRYAAGGVRQIDLAREFGVGESTVANIVHERTWSRETLERLAA